MKACYIVVKSNLKKRKTYNFSLWLLTFLATVSLTVSLGIITKTTGLYEDSYLASGESELIFGFAEEVAANAAVKLQDKQQINEVEKEYAAAGTVAFEEEQLAMVFSVYDQQRRPYQLYQAADSLESQLKANEIIVPFSFQEDHNCTLGQIILINGTSYLIKGFFEDPIYGSPYYHTKRVLISKEQLEQVKKQTGIQNLIFLNIDLKAKENAERQKAINELINEMAELPLLSFDQLSLTTMRTAVSRIILMILFVFSLFLFLILAVVVRYMIMAAIADERAVIGVLKALGFKNSNVTFTLLLQYILIIGAALAAGIAGAYGVAPTLGSFLLRTSGILWRGNIKISVVAVIVLTVLSFSLVIVYLQTSKTTGISPVEAISMGKTAHSESRGLPLSGGFWQRVPITPRMSIKQITADPRQYLSQLMLAIIFSFMILTVMGLGGAFNSSEKVAAILGYDLNDFSLQITDSKQATAADVEQVVAELDSRYGVAYYSVYDPNTKIYAAGSRTQLLIFSEFQTSNVLKGTIPAKDNEIMISHGVSKELSKTVGDTLALALSENSEKITYQIVGINNQIYGMGRNISMTDTGFRLLVADFSAVEFLLKLKDNSQLEKKLAVIETELLSETPGLTVVNQRELTMKRIQAIQEALNAISFGVVVISLVLIAVITFLVATIIIKRETQELGILKSLGFTSRQIRIQFALRFALIALAGSLVGTFANLVSDNFLINSLFSAVNIAAIPNGLSPVAILFTNSFIILSTLLFAWLVSEKIKKGDVKTLLAE